MYPLIIPTAVTTKNGCFSIGIANSVGPCPIVWTNPYFAVALCRLQYAGCGTKNSRAGISDKTVIISLCAAFQFGLCAAPKIFLQYKYCMWKHSHSPTWKVRAFGDDALNPFTIISAVTERDIRYNLSRSCCDPEVLRCFVDPKNSKRPWVKSQVGFHSIAGAWWWFPKKNEPSLTRNVGKGREVFTIIYPDLLPFMMVL